MQHTRCIPKSGASRSAGKTETDPFPKSLMRHPGGKSSLRRRFIGTILQENDDGVDREFREPFVGGASVAFSALSDARIKKAWLNDYDPSITALWTAVQSRPDDLCEAIRSCQPSAEEFYRLKDYFLTTSVAELRSIDPVELGANKLFIHRISHNGNGPKSGGPQGGRKGGNKISDRWKPDELCRRVPILHRLLSEKDVRITSLDFETV